MFARLWRSYLAAHKGRMALAFLFMVIEGATLGFLSWQLEPLFDDVFTEGADGALLSVGLVILALFLIRALAMIIGRGLMAAISARVAAAMQTDLLRHILRLDGAFFQDHAPGQLIERVQGDTIAVQGVWSTLLMGIGRDLVALIGLVAVALSIDWRWTLATLVGAPLLILPTAVVQRYIRRKTDQLRDQAGLRATRLDEIFHGIQAIKLNRMEDYQTGRFARIVARIVRFDVRMTLGRAMMPAMIDIVTGIGFFAVLMLGGHEVARGERTVGEFMAFFTAMALTFQPIRRLGDLSGLWQVAAASLERVYRLLDTRPLTQRLALPTGQRFSAPTITLTDVTFAYGETQVLRGLTFTAPAGGVTALVGASGAGKTTVFHLLTGLIEPDAGQILIAGQDSATLSLADLRGNFAAVSQDAALFDETLRENILLGRDAPPDETLAQALAAAHVADFVAGLPAGLDTPAGPRGSALSGGQRQRIAIARALIADAPILLLDEATSALDAQSEALVSQALARLSQGRTTLVIAHRLSTVRNADKIVVMDQGRVAEEGRHDDLLAKGGLYAGLYKLQFKGE
ncbi:MAG: ABC transporter transmembrane domain-containing protein [Rhodobacteraceae bacterium]|nr:ABC transporter transmembrane domain-containing protein [Paracoccaceae bacterium]